MQWKTMLYIVGLIIISWIKRIEETKWNRIWQVEPKLTFKKNYAQQVNTQWRENGNLQQCVKTFL